MNNITLNNDQSTALEYIVDWFKSPLDIDNRMFSLIGSAGTGKTTTVLEVINALQVSTVVSAPTHKAVKVIERMTDREGKTLQSLLGLRPNVELENFNINFPQFDPFGEPDIQSYDLVIIDEASMINKDLFNFLLKESEGSEVRILFLGDELQLPPVKERISLIFNSVRYKYELTKIMRQESTNPIAPLLEAFRNSVKLNNIQFMDILKAPKIIDKRGFAVLADEPFEDSFVRAIASNQDCKYIAWTNANVQETNKAVREYLFKEEATTFIHRGEPMMAYQTVIKGYGNNAEPLLFNSEDYVVDYCQRPFVNSYGIKVSKVGLKAYDAIFDMFVVVPNEDNYNRYTEVHKAKIALTKKDRRNWAQFFQFSNSNILTNDVFEGKELIQKKHLDYGYGITVHKSQGSTYETVFLDYANISKSYNRQEALKLLYVGASRAKNLIIFKK